MTTWRKAGQGIAVLVLAVFAVLAVWMQRVNGPKRDEAADQLRHVLASVAAPAEAVPVREPAYGKNHGVLEKVSFRYRGPVAEVGHFYDATLVADGWQPCQVATRQAAAETRLSRNFRKSVYAISVSQVSRPEDDASFVYAVTVTYVPDNDACSDS